MCCLLANQFNSVFTKPKQISVIKDPVPFFLSHATREDDLFLTDITRNFPQTQQVVPMASLLLF